MDNGKTGGNGMYGGTGNPGGNQSGTNGTGGLLVIYTNILNNNGKITSKGSNSYDGGGASGGGSVNIFYSRVEKEGVIDATGGSGTENDRIGGDGGNGCITLTNIR